MVYSFFFKKTFYIFSPNEKVIMKKLIKKLLKKVGYDILKIKKEFSFDDIIKINLDNNPIIFDVGANEGQSIKRFKNVFKNSIIHSFEPNFNAFKLLKKNYSNLDSVFLNNSAVGDKIEKKPFYETTKTTHSSFHKLNEKSEWIKIRSKELQTSIKNYTTNIREVEITTLDNYCKINKIDFIDLLKIDTQGYEEQVLAGCKYMIKNKLINLIETEIMLDDVYHNNTAIYDLEKYLNGSYRLIGIKPKLFNNIYEGYLFSLDLIYKKL